MPFLEFELNNALESEQGDTEMLTVEVADKTLKEANLHKVIAGYKIRSQRCRSNTIHTVSVPRATTPPMIRARSNEKRRAVSLTCCPQA